MNKSVMNAIEVLSANFNFSIDDAVSILTTNNKKSRSKVTTVKPKKEVEDLFAQLVNDAEDAFDVAVKEALDKNPIRSIEEDNELHKRNQQVLDNICKEVDGEFVLKSESSESTDKKKTKKTVMTAEEKEAVAEAKKQEKLALAEAKKAAKEQEKMNKELDKQAAQALKEIKQENEKKEKMVKEMEKLKAKELAKIKPTKEELAKKKEEEKLAAAEAKKVAKEQEKLAKEEAKKVAAEAKKAAKEQEKKEKKSVNKKSTKPESQDTTTTNEVTETPVKVSVRRIKIGEHEYLKSESNILYNPETKEEVGLYDVESNSIKPLPDDDEEELEEDSYDM
jgi:hypothetical protein